MTILYINIVLFILISTGIILIRNYADEKRFGKFKYSKVRLKKQINDAVYYAYLDSNPSNVAQTNSFKLVVEEKGMCIIKERIIRGYYFYLLEFELIEEIEIKSQGIFRPTVIVFHKSEIIESPFKFRITASPEEVNRIFKNKAN